MNILHLAAGNRWTGAAAPAFAEVEALREAGHEAHYAYVGGYKLQAKLAAHPFAHPSIDRAQNPVSFIRSARAIRRLITAVRIDVVHAHLTWDHWLALFAVRGTGARIARTFHSRRTLRTDPLTAALLRRTASVFIINDTFRDAAALRSRSVTFTPPPLDRRLFTPGATNVRARYGIDPLAKVLTVIGKLAPGRGFENALRTFAHVRSVEPDARLMIIGHGDHRPVLERLAADLDLSSSVVWAGYHEDDLPDHYRAGDVLLFTAAGSDEGHRAVIEALGCGLPPVVFPLAGMEAILGPLAPQLIASAAAPEALAHTAARVLSVDRDSLAARLAERSRDFEFGPAAARLVGGYGASDLPHVPLI